MYGSWLLQKLGWDFVHPEFLIALIIICMVLFIAAYRYYTGVVRLSLLADMALIFYLGAFASAFIDVGVRGFTVDFIQLTGYVVADFKDVYLWFGAACLLAELFDAPGSYWKMSPVEFLRALS